MDLSSRQVFFIGVLNFSDIFKMTLRKRRFVRESFAEERKLRQSSQCNGTKGTRI